MSGFSYGKVCKREIKEEIRTHFKNGSIQGLLDVKEKLRNTLGTNLGNIMYDDILRKVKKEVE